MFEDHILKSTRRLICSVQVKGVCNKHQQAFKCQAGMFLRVAVTERPCSKVRIEVFSFSRLPLFPLIYLKGKRVHEYTLCVLHYKCTVQCVCVCVGGCCRQRVMRGNLIYHRHEESANTHTHMHTQAYFTERFQSIFLSHVYQIPRK